MKRASIVLFAAAFIFCSMAVSPAGATTTIDVGSDQALCRTQTSVIKFDTPLRTGGTTPESGTMSGKLGGCTDLNNLTVQMFKGMYKGTFGTANNDCVSWFTLNLFNFTAGSSTITWSPARGQNFAPKTLVGSAMKNIETATNDNWNSAGGGTVAGSPSGFQLSGSYIEFSMLSVAATGEFAGSGDTSMRGFLQSDYGLLFAQCAAAGVTSVTVGLGDFGT